ncbi:MAG: type II toxin-antitoxin system VapC family toxin [Opitutales bacterium]
MTTCWRKWGMGPGIDTGFLVAWALAEHPGHAEARQWVSAELSAHGSMVLTPQVIQEWIHVVTDPRRFTKPLTMKTAVEQARQIWTSHQIRQVFPTEASTSLALQWLEEHRLGRKRILDTTLAATYYIHDIRVIATTDLRDFSIFGVFEVVTL